MKCIASKYTYVHCIEEYIKLHNKSKQLEIFIMNFPLKIACIIQRICVMHTILDV